MFCFESRYAALHRGSGKTGCKPKTTCAENNGGCDTQSVCRDTGAGSSCGPCPAGFSGTGATGCVDIDGCVEYGSPCFSGVECTDIQAGWLLRTSTRPKMDVLLLLRASVCAFTPKVSHSPISVECLLSTTLLQGAWTRVHVRPVPAGVQGQRHALRYLLHGGVHRGVLGRGLHSFAFQLNVSAFCGIGVRLWVV